MTLIDRARQFATQAQQVDTTYLGALASADTETYNLMKARAAKPIHPGLVRRSGD